MVNINPFRCVGCGAELGSVMCSCKPKKNKEFDFLMKILEITAFDHCNDLFWRVDGEYAPLTVFVKCNDLFAWGLADAEPLTKDNIDILEQSYKDSFYYGSDLFCCRVRKMRPQKAFYKRLTPQEKELFDACGPERIG